MMTTIGHPPPPAMSPHHPPMLTWINTKYLAAIVAVALAPSATTTAQLLPQTEVEACTYALVSRITIRYIPTVPYLLRNDYDGFTFPRRAHPSFPHSGHT